MNIDIWIHVTGNEDKVESKQESPYKHGKWRLDKSYVSGAEFDMCPFCLWAIHHDVINNFCVNCGAKLEHETN